MKQKFSKETHKKFKDFFSIKKYPSLINVNFIERTKNYIKFIKWIPGIKMIGIGNSISMNCNTEKSDIDLFIVTGKNRLWLVRILITIIFGVLGVKKTKNKHKARFCLSFFTTTKGMDFNAFALKNDVYLYFWIVYMKPILNYNNTYEKFIENNSSWADFQEYKKIIEKNKNYIFYTNKKHNKKSLPEILKDFIIYPFNKTISLILNIINYLIKIIFLPRTTKKWKNMGKPFGVVIGNDILKFHDKDKRKIIKKELMKKKKLEKNIGSLGPVSSQTKSN